MEQIIGGSLTKRERTVGNISVVDAGRKREMEKADRFIRLCFCGEKGLLSSSGKNYHVTCSDPYCDSYDGPLSKRSAEAISGWNNNWCKPGIFARPRDSFLKKNMRALITKRNVKKGVIEYKQGGILWTSDLETFNRVFKISRTMFNE